MFEFSEFILPSFQLQYLLAENSNCQYFVFGVFDLTWCYNIECKHSINEFKAERGNKLAPRIKQTNTLLGWKNSCSPSYCWSNLEWKMVWDDAVSSALLPSECFVWIRNFYSQRGSSTLLCTEQEIERDLRRELSHLSLWEELYKENEIYQYILMSLHIRVYLCPVPQSNSQLGKTVVFPSFENCPHRKSNILLGFHTIETSNINISILGKYKKS